MTPKQIAALSEAIPPAQRKRVEALMAKFRAGTPFTAPERAELHALAMKAAAIVAPPAIVAAALERVERARAR
jgi:hypothetical protein